MNNSYTILHRLQDATDYKKDAPLFFKTKNKKKTQRQTKI